ncbi:hypothetical protein [Paraburkholderia sp. MM6662-R1]|uniref:hypothetical protein n=1 Tax=Paraburkholderia sp. MM6662-R1 TaxID=2991066 RepID=UPI003D229048
MLRGSEFGHERDGRTAAPLAEAIDAARTEIPQPAIFFNSIEDAFSPVKFTIQLYLSNAINSDDIATKIRSSSSPFNAIRINPPAFFCPHAAATAPALDLKALLLHKIRLYSESHNCRLILDKTAFRILFSLLL